MSIKDKVAIVGVGCCKFGENWDKSEEDMIVDDCGQQVIGTGDGVQITGEIQINLVHGQ